MPSKPISEIGAVQRVDITVLLPEQVQEHWKPWVESLAQLALPDALKGDQGTLLEMFSHSLAGNVRALLVEAVGETGRSLIAQALVSETQANFGNQRVLNLMALRALQEVSLDVWKLAFGVLARAARERGCAAIVTFTDEPAVVRLATGLGAQKFNLLEWNL